MLWIIRAHKAKLLQVSTTSTLPLNYLHTTSTLLLDCSNSTSRLLLRYLYTTSTQRVVQYYFNIGILVIARTAVSFK